MTSSRSRTRCRWGERPVNRLAAAVRVQDEVERACSKTIPSCERRANDLPITTSSPDSEAQSARNVSSISTKIGGRCWRPRTVVIGDDTKTRVAFVPAQRISRTAPDLHLDIPRAPFLGSEMGRERTCLDAAQRQLPAPVRLEPEPRPRHAGDLERGELEVVAMAPRMREAVVGRTAERCEGKHQQGGARCRPVAYAALPHRAATRGRRKRRRTARKVMRRPC